MDSYTLILLINFVIEDLYFILFLLVLLINQNYQIYYYLAFN